MMHIPFISLLIIVPLLGALICSLAHKNEHNNIKNMTLWISFVNLLITGIIFYKFDFNSADFQFVEKHLWIESIRCFYNVGIDNVSIYFLGLVALLMPICLWYSCHTIKEGLKGFIILLLILQSFMIGVFVILDVALFFVFFEGSLIPLFIIIGF